MIADTRAEARHRVRPTAEIPPAPGNLDAVVGLLACAPAAARRRLLGVLLRAAAEGA